MKKVLQLALKGYNPFQSSSKTPHGLHAHRNEEPLSFFAAKNMKKIVVIFILACFAVGSFFSIVSCGSPQSISYTNPLPKELLKELPKLSWDDLPEDEIPSFYRWGISYLQQCYSMHLFSEEEVQNPGREITRREFLSKLCLCLGLVSDVSGKLPYIDIDPKDSFSSTLLFAIENGILESIGESDSDLHFYPDKPLQRWEASMWLANAKKVNYSFFEENIISIFAQDAIVEFPSQKAYLAMAICLSPNYQLLQYRWSKDSIYRMCKPFSGITICEASYGLFHFLFPPKATPSIDILKRGSLKNTQTIVKEDMDLLSSYIYVSPISKRDMNWGYSPILVEEIPSIEKGTMQCLNDGRIQCTFKIRDYLRWSDGTPIIASHAKYGFQFAELYLDESVPFDWLLGIKEVSNNEVIVTWKRSFFGVERAFYLYPEFVQDSISWDTYKTAAPYIPSKVEKEQITVERNFNCNLYSPNTHSIHIHLVHDEIDFQKEPIQLACNFQSNAVSDLGQGSIVSYPSLQWEHVDFKLPNKILYDKKVRAALCEVLSEEDMQKIIWEDRGFFSSGWFLPLHPSLQIKSISKTNSVMAEELLLEAGWENDDGILKKDQEPFTITLLYLLSDDKREEVVEYIKECWESLGIKVQIEPCDENTFFSHIQEPSPNEAKAFLYSWIFTADSNLFSILHSTAIPGMKKHQVSENYSGFQNQEVDRLLVKTLTEPVFEKRAENMWKIQAIAREECTVIPLYYIPVFGYINTSMWGVFVPYSGISLDWAPEYWYLLEQ